MLPFLSDRALVFSVVAGRPLAASAFAHRFWRFLVALEGQYTPDFVPRTPVHPRLYRPLDLESASRRTGPRDLLLDLWADGHRLLRDWNGEGDFVDHLGPVARRLLFRRSWIPRSLRPRAEEDRDVPIERLYDAIGPKPRTEESVVLFLRELQRLPWRDYRLLYLKFAFGQSSERIGAATSRSAEEADREILGAVRRLRGAVDAGSPGPFVAEDRSRHPGADRLTALWTGALALSRRAPVRRHVEACATCRERLSALREATIEAAHPERVRSADLRQARRWARLETWPRKGTLSVHVERESGEMHLSFAAPLDRGRERIVGIPRDLTPQGRSPRLELHDREGNLEVTGVVREEAPTLEFHPPLVGPGRGRIELTSEDGARSFAIVDPDRPLPVYPVPSGTSRLVVGFRRPWHIRVERHDYLPVFEVYRPKPPRESWREPI